MTPYQQLPTRIRHYLLDWKDSNLDIYLEKYGELKLRDMTASQLYMCFLFATQSDISNSDVWPKK